MIVKHTTFCESYEIRRPGTGVYDFDSEDYSRKTVTYGTTPSRMIIQGNYRRTELENPAMLEGKPANYYAQKMVERKRDERAHIRSRWPVWVAKGAVYGTASLGAILLAKGVTAPIGAKLLVKSVAMGAAVGAVGGVSHGCVSTHPYVDLFILLRGLDQMHRTYNGWGLYDWMKKPDEVEAIRKHGKMAFDIAWAELREKGHKIVAPFPNYIPERAPSGAEVSADA